ncbi:MAG: dienelactone hydrolase family protein [Janthinobacterium lividum]
MGEWIEVKAADGHQLKAYKAAPEGQVRGAVVVVQEIFGVNAHIRSIADRLAAAGYLAVAPALFDRYERGVELKYEGQDLQKAYELYGKLDARTALLDVAAGFSAVAGEAKVGVMGFCYGGFMSWLSATRGRSVGIGPVCCVGFYPGGVGAVAQEEPSCPVMLHFGADDTHIGQEQVDAVRNSHPEVKIFVYEGAGHGFNCDMRESYESKAAELAWERSLEFLVEHVG